MNDHIKDDSTDRFSVWKDFIEGVPKGINTHLDSDALGVIQTNAKALRTLLASFSEMDDPTDKSI